MLTPSKASLTAGSFVLFTISGQITFLYQPWACVGQQWHTRRVEFRLTHYLALTRQYGVFYFKNWTRCCVFVSVHDFLCALCCIWLICCVMLASAKNRSPAYLLQSWDGTDTVHWTRWKLTHRLQCHDGAEPDRTRIWWNRGLPWDSPTYIMAALQLLSGFAPPSCDPPLVEFWIRHGADHRQLASQDWVPVIIK